MKMRIIFSIICIVTIFNICTSTPVNSCGETTLLPEVNVSDCDILPCTFYKEHNASFNLTFRAPYYLDNIAPSVYASVGGINVSYPLGQKDACEGIINTPCPIVEGEKVVYAFAIEILRIFPEVSLLLQFNIMNLYTNQSVCCFKVDAQVKQA